MSTAQNAIVLVARPYRGGSFFGGSGVAQLEAPVVAPEIPAAPTVVRSLAASIVSRVRALGHEWSSLSACSAISSSPSTVM